MKTKRQNVFPWKNTRWLHIIIVILFVLSVFLSLNVLSKPNVVTDNIQDNEIRENANFIYKADVSPCAIYPKGGVIDPEGFIITKITKSIILNVSSSITADKPVAVKGVRSLTYSIVAENLWERSFTLEKDKSFDLNGTDNKIIDGQYKLNLQEILSYIDQAEKDTGTKPNKYILKIIPKVTGNIVGTDRTIPLSTIPGLTFEINYGQLILINKDGEPGTTINNFLNIIPVESSNTTLATYNLAGLKIPLQLLKYIFPILALGLFILYMFMQKSKIRLFDVKTLSESEKINRKYKNRLIYLRGQINTDGKSILIMESFKSLLSIADDRELSILCIRMPDESVQYCVADGDYIYCYKADDCYINEEVPVSEINSLIGK